MFCRERTSTQYKRYVSKCFPLPEMRYRKARGTNVNAPHIAGHNFVFGGKKMINGHFYFIKNSFYDSLSDCNLMTNKGNDFDCCGGRPCHYCFEYEDYFWMIPISSQVDKFKSIYQHKIEKRGFCDTIRFGYINGKERAFLIQNCFPVTKEYIDEEYKINKNTVSVTISEDLSKELNGLLRKVIRCYANGQIIPLTKIDKIMKFLNK